MNNGYFKTGKRMFTQLQTAIDNAENIKGFQEILDKNFAYLYFDLDGKEAEKALNGEKFDCPYWMETYWDKYNEKGEIKYWCEYVEGYHDPLKIGDVVAGDFKYVDSQMLDTKIEHQAEDGKCIYEYRGYSYLRIWEKL